MLILIAFLIVKKMPH